MAEPIVVLDGYTLSPTGDVDWAPVKALGSLTIHDRIPVADAVARIGNARLVLTNKAIINADVLARVPNVKYIGVLATGTNIVDLKAAREKGIAVTNVPGYSTASVAQLVFALTLELACHTARHAYAVAEGKPVQWWNIFALGFLLLKELSGEAAVDRAQACIPRKVDLLGGSKAMAKEQRSQAYVAAAEKRFDGGPNRCC